MNATEINTFLKSVSSTQKRLPSLKLCRKTTRAESQIFVYSMRIVCVGFRLIDDSALSNTAIRTWHGHPETAGCVINSLTSSNFLYFPSILSQPYVHRYTRSCTYTYTYTYVFQPAFQLARSRRFWRSSRKSSFESPSRTWHDLPLALRHFVDASCPSPSLVDSSL